MSHEALLEAGPRLPPAGARGLRVAVLAAGGSGTGGGDAAGVAVEVARRLERSEEAAKVELRDLGEAYPSRSDPFRLRERVAELGCDVAVVVAPRRWGPRRIIPAPLIAGRVLALVQASPGGARASEDDAASGPDPDAPWVVAAMGKDVFLQPTAHWAATLAGAGRRVVDLRADRARRDDLVAAFGAGPGMVLYAGHGRTRGWGGYQGLRWSHLQPPHGQARRPAGLVIAFACDTLKRMKNGAPFGSRLVASGVARAYLGAAGPILTADAEALAEAVIGLLAEGRHPTVAHLLRAIGEAVRANPAATRAWRQFRLLGEPLTRLGAAGSWELEARSQLPIQHLSGQNVTAVLA